MQTSNLSIRQGTVKQINDMPGFVRLEQIIIEIEPGWVEKTVYIRNRFVRGQMLYIFPKGYVLPDLIKEKIPDDYKLDNQGRVQSLSWDGFTSTSIVFPLNNPTCTHLYRIAENLRLAAKPLPSLPTSSMFELDTAPNIIKTVDYTPTKEISAEDLGINRV